MLNKCNSFIHLVPHLPFAVAMFLGSFLRACLGPQLLTSTPSDTDHLSEPNTDINDIKVYVLFKACVG